MKENNEFEPYKIVYCGAVVEIVEKKSRFIASICKVATEEEALSFINETKKKYWDATHNCYAFVIGSKAEAVRCSDDGEPSGTAGKPMLDILLKENIKNVAVVVTRYFGGTLLGTGGLVRAYSRAVKEGLEECAIKTVQYGVTLSIITDYNGIGKIQHILGSRNIPIEQSEYTQNVRLIIKIPINQAESLQKEIIEATNAKAKVEELNRLYF